MREVVVRGIVEVMNDQQLTRRSHSLHTAINRLSEAREQRDQSSDVLELTGGSDRLELDTSQSPRHRRGLFTFGERGQEAVR